MRWQMTGDVAEFLDAAGDDLRREPARNTVLLTVTEQMRRNPVRYSPVADGPGRPGRPLFGWWTGQAGWAFMHTPPSPLLLTAVPGDVAAELAAALTGRPLSGVNAYPEAAERFAATWVVAANCQIALHNRQRLYRLAELAWPQPAPEGIPRAAALADVPLVAEWFAAFGREANDLGGPADQAPLVRDRLGHGGVMLWVAGGVPVSVAAASRQVAGMIRVGPVYTPPELRGHGYASAATAALSRQALAAGAEEVVLYTDLANPVANSIYQRIGYRPLEDRVLLAFAEPALPAWNLAFPGGDCILEGIM
jgi:GNAT superfamily N-acetyltransferase